MTQQLEKQEMKGNISMYAFALQKDGIAKSTIHTRVRKLTHLSEQCNINNPEEAKETLAKLPLAESTKKSIAAILHGYYKHYKIKWKKPKYTPPERLPFIPTEQEIDQLIAACGKTTGTFLQTLKETGIRSGEAHLLKWIDFDIQRRTLNITPEKRSNPRVLPISQKLADRLNNVNKTRETIFMKNKHTQRNLFDKQRKTAAKNLANPRLLKISFHTLRHWKGTMEYHKTRDVIHVKTILGHKDVKSTMIYINLEQALFATEENQFYTATAKTIEEASKLINEGWEYTQIDIDGTKLFRKRK